MQYESAPGNATHAGFYDMIGEAGIETKTWLILGIATIG
jgi:hypothetical protein